MSAAPAELDMDPTDYVDQAVTLVGIARDAQSGAVVLLADGTPVYIKGLRSWDAAWDRKRIRVRGTLRERKLAPDPGQTAKGERNPGKHGDDLILDGAEWEEAR